MYLDNLIFQIMKFLLNRPFIYPNININTILGLSQNLHTSFKI